MHSYRELISDKLSGIAKLFLSEDPETFPVEIFELAETLEIQDLSSNRLSSLPDDLQDFKS